MKYNKKNGFVKINSMFNKLNTIKKTVSDGILAETKIFKDGKKYAIIKEGFNYHIKYSEDINAKIPEEFKSLEGVFNKTKLIKTRLSESKKMFNFLDIEISRNNVLCENLDEIKHVLKIKKPESEIDSPPEDAAFDNEMPEDDITNDESLDDIDGEDSFDDESPEDFDEDNTEDDPKTYIQKLSGKLSYKLGQYTGDDYSNTAKYALNMLISSIDGNKIDDNDKKDITSKLDSKFEGEDEVDGESQDEFEGGEAEMEENIMLEIDGLYEDETTYIDDNIKQWVDKVVSGYNYGNNNLNISNIIINFLEINGIDITSEIMDSIDSELDMINGGLTSKHLFNIIGKYLDLDSTQQQIDDDDIVDLVKDLEVDENENIDTEYTLEEMLGDDFIEQDCMEDNDSNEDLDGELLFDDEIEEEVYSQSVPIPKNKKYAQKYMGDTIGRIEGDDDAQDNKRDPFKY